MIFEAGALGSTVAGFTARNPARVFDPDRLIDEPSRSWSLMIRDGCARSFQSLLSAECSLNAGSWLEGNKPDLEGPLFRAAVFPQLAVRGVVFQCNL